MELQEYDKKAPGPESPHKFLHNAILKVIAPPQSVETQEAVANAKKKRKRVQAVEEVLTTPSALQRLRDEAEARVAKKLTKNYSSLKLRRFDFGKENLSEGLY